MWIRASFLLLVLSGPALAGPLLPDCPSSPNCVSSLASDPDKRVAPLPGADTRSGSLALLRELLSEWPRVSLKPTPDDSSLVHAVFSTRLFGFHDDVHFHVREDGGIEVRSASRLGYWDLGTNRRRVEKFRRALKERLESDDSHATDRYRRQSD